MAADMIESPGIRGSRELSFSISKVQRDFSSLNPLVSLNALSNLI